MLNENYGLPKNAALLGLNMLDFNEVKKKIGLSSKLAPYKRQVIFDRAEETINLEEITVINHLILELIQDKETLYDSGIDFFKNTDMITDIVACGILEYMLEHPEKTRKQLPS
jgi:hypothetical protein